MRRVLAICLDGYEHGLAVQMMRVGLMPALHALARVSARFELDHGSARRTGLAGEHIATGLSPSDMGRAAAVHFDPETYGICQRGSNSRPFAAAIPLKTAVFDPTYFDIDRAPEVRGIVGWGAHDPGVPPGSHPNGLLPEFEARFGAYPAKKWIYGLPWNSVEDSRNMGESLTRAVRLRAEAAEWLLAERLPNWDLALMTVSEPHSVIEGLWHGVDPLHPLRTAPSAAVAGQGVRAVYRALDDLVGRLCGRFGDATVVLFSMHGMGANTSDAASMLLLAELMYRDSFGTALFNREGVSAAALGGQVELPAGETWVGWVRKGFPPLTAVPRARDWLLDRRVVQRLNTLRRRKSRQVPIRWMPASLYQPHWRRMRTFCLPSFYDGRVRINLAGRERHGVVPPLEYEAERDRIIQLLAETRDTVTGQPVVRDVEYQRGADTLSMGPTDADLVFVWAGAPSGFCHPRLGQIGPIPYRRTGGHTGGAGFAYLAGTPLAAGDYGPRNAFDVVPTVLDLLGAGGTHRVSGASLLGSRVA